MYIYNNQKYTLDQLNEIALVKGYTLQELFAKNPGIQEIKPEESGKVQSVIPGAIAETIAAPKVNMDLPSEDTSLDLQKIQREFDRGKFKTAEKEAYENYKLTGELDADLLPEPTEKYKEPNFFQQLGNAFSGGLTAANLDDFYSRALVSKKYGQNLSDEKAEQFRKLINKQRNTPLSKGEKDWEKTYDEVAKSPGIPGIPNWFKAGVTATILHPEAALLYGTRSAAQAFSPEVATGTAAATAAGGLIGAGVGSVIASVPGAIAGGGVGLLKGLQSGIGASVELFASFGEVISEEIPKNPTIEEIQNAFKNEKLIEKARDKAIARTGVITLFDFVAPGVGAKVVKPVAKKLLSNFRVVLSKFSYSFKNRCK